MTKILVSTGLKVSQTVETDGKNFKTREDDAYVRDQILLARISSPWRQGVREHRRLERENFECTVFRRKIGVSPVSKCRVSQIAETSEFSHLVRVSEAHAHGAIFSRGERKRNDFEHVLYYETKLGSCRCAGFHKLRKLVNFWKPTKMTHSRTSTFCARLPHNYKQDIRKRRRRGREKFGYFRGIEGEIL